MTFFFPPRKRLDYVNHARRLAEDDWTGMESEEEEEKKDDEKMEVDTGKKLPKRYANQVSGPEKIRCSWSRSIYCAIRALYLTMNREEDRKNRNCIESADVQNISEMKRWLTALCADACRWWSLDSGFQNHHPMLLAKASDLLPETPELLIC